MDEYLLGGLNVRWESDLPLLPSPFFGLFRTNGSAALPDILLRGSTAPLAPLLGSPCLSRGEVYDRYQSDGHPLPVYHWGQLREGFAVFPHRITAAGGDAVCFDPNMKGQPPLPADWFFGVSGLHRALLLRDAPILHASYIDYRGQAILFAAPSQTGKSTQAALWQSHAAAEIINGDRVLLRRVDGRWHAFGYPCCGSSGICLNRTLPLAAVVLLSQSPADRVEELSPGNRVRALVSGMQLYPWLTDETDAAFSLAERLCDEIPVIRLACTPTADAVAELKEYLEVNGIVYSQ